MDAKHHNSFFQVEGKGGQHILSTHPQGFYLLSLCLAICTDLAVSTRPTKWLVNMADVLYGSVTTSREPNIKICADNKLQIPTYVA